MELLVELAVYCACGLLLGQLIQFLVQLVLCGAIILNVDVCSATGLSHLATHILVEGRHNGISGIILHIVAGARDGYWRALGRAHTQYVYSHSGILGGLGSLECPTLVVLTIGNHDDSLADAFLLGKAMCSHIDGTGDISALSSHHRWVDTRQEHLGRNIVAGDRQLHECIACKHDETNLIISKVVNQILYHHLTAIQSARRDILGHHRVTDIHRNDGLDAHTLLVVDLGAKLRTGQHHDEQCQSALQNPEFHSRTESRHIGHQFAQQFGIAKLTQAFLLIAIRKEADDGQHWYHR